jgi:hypothetical protein
VRTPVECAFRAYLLDDPDEDARDQDPEEERVLPRSEPSVRTRTKARIS